MSVDNNTQLPNGDFTWMVRELPKGESAEKYENEAQEQAAAAAIGVITDEVVYNAVAKYDRIAQALHCVSKKLFAMYIKNRIELVVDYGSGNPSMRIIYQTFTGRVLMSALKIEASFGQLQKVAEAKKEKFEATKEQKTAAEKGFTEEMQRKNPHRKITAGATAWIRVPPTDADYDKFNVGERRAYLLTQSLNGSYIFRVVEQEDEADCGYAALLKIYTDNPQLLKGATLSTVDSYESGNGSGQSNALRKQSSPYGARTIEDRLKKNESVESLQKWLTEQVEQDMQETRGKARQANMAGAHLFALNKNDGVSRELGKLFEAGDQGWNYPKMKSNKQEVKDGKPVFENRWPDEPIAIHQVLIALDTRIAARKAEYESDAGGVKKEAIADLKGLLVTRALLDGARSKRGTTTVRIAEFNLGNGETIKATWYLGDFVRRHSTISFVGKAARFVSDISSSLCRRCSHLTARRARA